MSEPHRRATTGRTTDRDLSRRALLGGLCTAVAGTSLAGCVRVAGHASSEQDAAADDTLTRTCDFRAGVRRRETTVVVPEARYQRAQDAHHSIPAAFEAAQQAAYLGPVAADLAARTDSRADAITAAQSLAVSIEYETDAESTGQTEFVRFAVETLVDRVGDCEDKAVLLAGLLSRPPLDCRTGLVLLPDHCATLVARADLPAERIADEPISATVDGTEFVYLEAVEQLAPGRAASDYGERPLLAAYDGDWTLIDVDAAVESTRETISQRGLGVIDAFI